jgi:hypothetical protein
MTDPTIVIGFLLAAHLAADFVLQTDEGVAGRNGPPRRAVRSLGIHFLLVAAFMLPFWPAFGTPGLLALLLVAVPHPFVDAAKTYLTRRVGGSEAGEYAWSPARAMLFILDQAVHVALIAAAWWFFLRDAVPNPALVDWVRQATSGAASADLHTVVAMALVGWALLVVNGPAARYLIELILPPDGDDAAAGIGPDDPIGYSVKVGPFSGRIEPDQAPDAATQDKVGATVGVLERLLVVVLILGRAEVGIGLVVAAKTLARFKQLDQRPFAEKYLVGTLSSVTIAVASGLLARVVLS